MKREREGERKRGRQTVFACMNVCVFVYVSVCLCGFECAKKGGGEEERKKKRLA